MKSKLVKAYIIDDNRSSIDILKKMLEDNYSVEVIGTTTDAQDGLRGIEELSPDILFLDIEMPDISGLEVCPTLKDILSNDTKVVFYTEAGIRLSAQAHTGFRPQYHHEPLLREQA